MGRKKAVFRNGKVSNFAPSEDRPKARKKFSDQFKKEYEEVVSLSFLMDSKNRKKINDLDDRMKRLKSELESLFSGAESKDKGEKLRAKETTDCSKKSHDDRSKVSERNAKSPKKFSDWLDKTIDDITVQTKSERQILRHNSESIAFSTEAGFKSKFLNSLSEKDVEELLFKSFYLQVLGIDLCGSSDTKGDKESSRTKDKSFRKRNGGRWRQRSSDKRRRSRQRVEKRRKTDRDSFSDNNIEIVDVDGENWVVDDQLESHLCDYDWDEPFDLDDRAESFSDPGASDSGKSSHREEPKCSGSVERQSRAPDDSRGNDRSKSGWECPICFEHSTGQEVVATLCGHIFCKRCLENYCLRFSKICPTCRTDLTNKETIPLFNL